MLSRRVGLIGVTVALLLLLLVASPYYWAAASPQAPAAEAKDSKLQGLLKERLATLREIAAQTDQAYRAGQATMEQVVQANQSLLAAELDLCASAKERIAILQKGVELAKQQEEVAMQRSRAGVAPAYVPLKAKVNRLEAEIALERAKAP